jgi:GDPmannose 4,6-dehydratase
MEDKCRIYQASSSEMFGKVEEHPQNESTVFNPQTLYGVSKVAAHCLIKNYREMYGLYACSGILYNHESPRRSDKFVTQKIIQGLKSGKCFEIGNLESRRDWGHARDYVEAMWIALQQDKPDDYVVATGKTHSVREFIEIAVNKMNKTITWSGENENEYGTIDGEVVVKVSKAFYRPYDVGLLVGDSSKIEKLGWSRKYDMEDLIEDMLKNME